MEQNRQCTDSDNVPTDMEKNRQCTDRGSSSVDTGSEHVFLDTESKNARAEVTLEYPPVDKDSLDSPDTLTLARLDRESQGPWEVEYSYGGEADLHLHHDNCTKNPGHKNFIPVDNFSMENLPEGYRDKDIFDFIRAESDLTVRVTVKYVSDKRPKYDDISGKPYPSFSDRGKKKCSVGTGWVNKVKVVNESRFGTCQCQDCRKSPTPQSTFSTIEICTASHVVYDASEGDHTTCHLFFDRGGRPEACKGVVTLRDMFCTWNDIGSDHTNMYHYTHDVGLAQRLAQRCQQRDDLRDKVFSKPQHTWNFKRRLPAPDKQPLLFIVSHPHGCSKQISLGRWTSAHWLYRNMHSYRYTAATCPGSSGARIYLQRKSAPTPLELDVLPLYESHVGKFDKQPGTNYCFSHSRIDMFEYVSLEFLQLDGELWGDNFSCLEEEELHKDYDTCQKNPGHQNFFPVDKFSMDNLPPCYRKDEIMKLIKTVSDLTVRVSVRYVSEQRPETAPGTDIPYPWYRNRGSNQLRVGSGRITKVELYEDEECQCEECEDSETPKIGYAQVSIDTASHLVYRHLEVGYATCHAFFDSGETPDVCKDAVELAGLWSLESEIEGDIFEILHYSHDLDLGGRLLSLTEDYWRLLDDCNEFNDLESRKRHGVDNPCAEPPLNIVVAHPHGCAKQVSLGYCDCHGNTDTEEHQCPYKSITCSGSSGAPTILLGWQTVYPCFG